MSLSIAKKLRRNVRVSLLLLGLNVVLLSCNPAVLHRTMKMQIVSSSMSPTLNGPRSVGSCGACKRDVSIDQDAVQEERATICPYCGAACEHLGLVEGDEVELINYEEGQHPRIGDLGVFQDPGKSFLEVKRIVGLPGQRVQLQEGDLWIDGVRYQKNEAEFLASAILVSRWPEHQADWQNTLAGNNKPNLGTTSYLYNHYSLWPRTTEGSTRHQSVLLDEYPNNPNESRYLVPVVDIGIFVDVDVIRPLDDDSSFSIEVWTPNRRYLCTILPSDSWLNRKDVSFKVLVAFVDGRWLAKMYPKGTDQTLFRFRDQEISAESQVAVHTQSTTPAYIEYTSEAFQVRSIAILRDLFYRGPEGEIDFAFPDPVLHGAKGYTVLGDNVSNSIDSRTNFPNGIAADWFVGRILPPRSRIDESVREGNAR